MDKGLQYKYDDYFIKNNRKQNSLEKVKYRKIAIANTLKKYCNLRNIPYNDDKNVIEALISVFVNIKEINL